MNGLQLCIVLLLAANAPAGTESASAQAGRAGEPRGALRTLWATSGPCVGLDRAAVLQEAEQKARRQLLAELGKLAEELSGDTLDSRQLVQEYAWLLSRPDVIREEAPTMDEKPYGPVAKHSISLHLPATAVTEWTARLAQQERWQILRMLCGAGGTLVWWLAGLTSAAGLDRATGGYYRRQLVPLVMVVLLAASALGWVWLMLVP